MPIIVNKKLSELDATPIVLVGDESVYVVQAGTSYRTTAKLLADLAFVGTKLINLNSGSLAASAPLLNLSQNWNNAGITFKAIVLDIAETASSGSSKFLDFSLDGASKFSVQKNGAVVSSDSGTFTNLITPVATLGGNSVTGSAPVLNATQTWNNAAVAFTALKLNVTDTASAGSLLMDLQVGGVSNFVVGKTGNIGSYSYPLTGIHARYEGTPIWINGQAWVNISVSNVTLDSRVGFGWCSGNANANPDLVLVRDAANTLALRNGTAAQAFNIYNTYTDASNYERGFMRWNAGVFEIGAEALGTGTLRDVRILTGVAKLRIRNSAGRELSIYNDGSYSWVGDETTAVYLAGAQSVGIGGAGPNGLIFHSASYGTLSGDVAMGRSVRKLDLTFGAIFSDIAAAPFSITAGPAYGSAATNLTGGTITFTGGAGASGSAGAAHGGNVVLSGGIGYGTGHNGYILMTNLPTSNPVVAGALWNNAGVLSVSAG